MDKQKEGGRGRIVEIIKSWGREVVWLDILKTRTSPGLDRLWSKLNKEPELAYLNFKNDHS